MIVSLFVGGLVLSQADLHVDKSIRMDSLCRLSPQEQKCWVSKSKDEGFAIERMAGFVCASDSDFAKIISKLKEEDRD